MAEKKFSPVGAQKEERCFLPKLSKSEIILNKNTLLAILNHNQKIRSRYDTLSFTAIPQDKWEYAIRIRKRVGSACKRNRIKRIVREAYRNAKPIVGRPHAILFFVNSKPGQIEYNQLKALLIQKLSNNV
ncbi:MAG: ribonuclease P protein component [Candidatus Marinimicrobia bacterium]|nr:ribonuclease P protein component [Candidatus Neomarinimicrobiota bacterium]